jgi:hypothetical protein
LLVKGWGLGLKEAVPLSHLLQQLTADAGGESHRGVDYGLRLGPRVRVYFKVTARIYGLQVGLMDYCSDLWITARVYGLQLGFMDYS